MSPSLYRIVLSLAVAMSCTVMGTIVGTVGGIDGAEAQRAPPKSASKASQAGNETDRALDGAAKALDAGNPDAAMTALDAILSGGGLSNSNMARALYLRGLAHRKKGRPAQAMADFTSAIWLKDGLNERDRTAALNARNEVTREVGVAAPAADRSETAPAGQSAPAATTQVEPRTRVASAPRPLGDDLAEAGFTRSFAAPAPAPPPASEPPASQASRGTTPAGPSVSSWQNSTTVDPKQRRPSPEPRQQVSAAPSPPPPSPAPASAPPANPPSAGGGFGSFFTGLFTGGSATPAEPPGSGSSQWRPRTDRWETTERPAGTRRVEPKVAAKVVEPKAGKGATRIATAALPGGAYRLQIATVRSRKEADAVAARMRNEHAAAIGNRQLQVDETVFGGMGTFYRVRLGPYANVNEPKTLCDQLRPKGYDCLVVTN